MLQIFLNLCRSYGNFGAMVTTATNVVTTTFTLLTDITQTLLRSPLLQLLPTYRKVHRLLWLHESARSVSLCGHFVSSGFFCLLYLPVFLSQTKTQWTTRLLQFTKHFKQLEVNNFNLFSTSNFRHVLNVVLFILGDSAASEFYMPTFRNTVPSS